MSEKFSLYSNNTSVNFTDNLTIELDKTGSNQ